MIWLMSLYFVIGMLLVTTSYVVLEDKERELTPEIIFPFCFFSALWPLALIVLAIVGIGMLLQEGLNFGVRKKLEWIEKHDKKISE